MGNIVSTSSEALNHHRYLEIRILVSLYLVDAPVYIIFIAFPSMMYLILDKWHLVAFARLCSFYV